MTHPSDFVAVSLFTIRGAASRPQNSHHGQHDRSKRKRLSAQGGSMRSTRAGRRVACDEARVARVAYTGAARGGCAGRAAGERHRGGKQAGAGRAAAQHAAGVGHRARVARAAAGALTGSARVAH
jgi:hypothetical protein